VSYLYTAIHVTAPIRPGFFITEQICFIMYGYVSRDGEIMYYSMDKNVLSYIWEFILYVYPYSLFLF